MTRDIPERESLTVEFKSDRARLKDRERVAAVAKLRLAASKGEDQNEEDDA
jgi:hypothetical protein